MGLCMYEYEVLCIIISICCPTVGQKPPFPLFLLRYYYIFLFIFRAKFGLFEIDFEDDKRTRTARLSALWYKNLIGSRTLDPVDEPKFEEFKF